MIALIQHYVLENLIPINNIYIITGLSDKECKKDTIYIITGLSDKECKKDTKNRMPDSIKKKDGDQIIYYFYFIN